jgi:hypothetical protein
VDVLVNNAAVQKNWRNPIKDPAGHDDRMYLHLHLSGSTDNQRIK